MSSIAGLSSVIINKKCISLSWRTLILKQLYLIEVLSITIFASFFFFFLSSRIQLVKIPVSVKIHNTGTNAPFFQAECKSPSIFCLI